MLFGYDVDISPGPQPGMVILFILSIIEDVWPQWTLFTGNNVENRIHLVDDGF